MGENIGAAARVMLNFGLRNLRIVSPRDDWPNPKAVEMAVGAVGVLDNALIFDSLEEVVADINYIYATTARPRDMVKPVVNLPDFPAELADKGGQDVKSGIMFGAEKSGLSNEEVVFADKILTIPVGDEYPSLNLAQAVGVVCYEISRFSCHSAVSKASEQDGGTGRTTHPSSKEELVHLFNHLEEELDNKGFFKVIEKRQKMTDNIRNIFSRAELTEQEIRTLRGIIRSLTEK